ncbi:glycosyltransferase [Acetobacter malorum]|uniref:glycosyltransferase n=1 Tax=Acetobacter malorum TaxID=178901 RepID=UPI00248E5F5D|nr:glycosyltransferase [Acetobacter malorum]
MSGIDVSLVLNVHREQDLLYPTLRSLLDTVLHAQLHEIKSELVIVADHADERTLTLLQNYDYTGFDAVRLENIEVRSLGLARNYGIEVAVGEYILTADADDLVSRNFIYELYQVHQAAQNKKIVVFPEYYHSFGDGSYVCRFYSLDQVGLYRMAGEHPYVSRFMARRADLLSVPYRDCSSGTLYAYEDYDINLRLICAGFDLLVGQNTIVFYRQRTGSIMASLGREQKRMVSNSAFFEGKEFLKLLQHRKQESVLPQTHIDFKKFYMESLYLRELVHQANLIEPEIHPDSLRAAQFFTNVGISQGFGQAYEKVCKAIQGKHYTDVFFLPFLSKGGGEKYVLNFIETAIKGGNRSCLLILGQQLCHSKERYQSPEGLDVLDLHEILDEHEAVRIPELAIRVIENFAPDARVFMKLCPFCESVMKVYAEFFKTRQLVYFYFCSAYYIMDGVIYGDGGEYRFLSNYRNYIDYVISDHALNLKQLEYRIPAYQGRTEALYTYSQPVSHPLQHNDGPRRLIWASRLDAQKRPDLLHKISVALQAENIATKIYVYGSPVLDHFEPEYFDDCPNVVYKGGFSGLGSIPFTNKDAFLYTSLFDGLPNVLLEAAQMQIPIITIDVGGVPELIQEKSGFLVHNCADDVELVARYVTKIKEFLSASEAEIQKKVDCLHQHFEQQHAQSIYNVRVAAVYARLEEQLAKGDA